MCVKIDLKLSTVCEKMSENRRPQGVFFYSHCICYGLHQSIAIAYLLDHQGDAVGRLQYLDHEIFTIRWAHPSSFRRVSFIQKYYRVPPSGCVKQRRGG